jgi:hypothetical protein
MAYELKENPIHGKVLAYKGKISVLPENQARPLAEKYNGALRKNPTGNYMIILPEHATTLTECECQNGMQMGMLMPQTYNQGDISFPDHEVQMARQELYRTAKLAMMTHEMLKHVGERQGLEGWVQSKLTRAADYIETVYAYLDYEMRYPTEMMPESKNLKKKKKNMMEKIQPIQPIQPIKGSRAGLGDEDPNKLNPPPKPAERVPGLVMMVPTDEEGQAAGPPIKVPAGEVALKQQNGYKVVGESASAGASSAGAIAGGPVAGAGSLFGGNYINRSNPFRKKKKIKEVIMKPEDMEDKKDRVPQQKDREDISDIISRMKVNQAMDTFNNGMPDILKQMKVKEQDSMVKNLPPEDLTGSNNPARTAKLASMASGQAAKATPDANAQADFMKQDTKESRTKPKKQNLKSGGETGPKFTGYWKGTDKGPPGKKMVGGGA